MVGRSNKVLFVEGTSDDKNGDLGRGFSTLLKQKLNGKMPRIYMGNGASQTVDEFKNAAVVNIKTLLIDMDGKGADVKQGNYNQSRASKSNLHNLTPSDLVYFMVQKMEAWFLSQPEVLEKHFHKRFDKIPFDHPSKIEQPDEELMKLTKELKFKGYHKVRDGSRLLGKLNLTKLEADFPDVMELVKKRS